MKRKYISNMPIEGFSKYHICKNGRLYSIHSGTWRLIKPVAKSTGYISNNLFKVIQCPNCKTHIKHSDSVSTTTETKREDTMST